MADEEFAIDDDEELSLLETLDHVLDHGLVIAGEVTIAVADVDLVYLGLNLLLGSVESVNRVLGERERRMELLRAPMHAGAVSLEGSVAASSEETNGGMKEATSDETGEETDMNEEIVEGR